MGSFMAVICGMKTHKFPADVPGLGRVSPGRDSLVGNSCPQDLGALTRPGTTQGSSLEPSQGCAGDCPWCWALPGDLGVALTSPSAVGLLCII